MEFTGDELADIREALFSKVGSLSANLETLADTIKALDAGETVCPLPGGAAGVRIAQDMFMGMRLHRDRLQDLAERTYVDAYLCNCGVFIPDPEDPNCPCG